MLSSSCFWSSGETAVSKYGTELRQFCRDTEGPFLGSFLLCGEGLHPYRFKIHMSPSPSMALIWKPVFKQSQPSCLVVGI